MDGSIAQTYLSDILHVVAQSLLAPDIILLLALIGYALFCIGSIIAELFSERRHFQVTMPKFLAALMAAQEDELPRVISQSGLLNRQKLALLTVYDYRMLPGDSLVALIRRLVNEEETRYQRVTDRNGMAARVAPMLGLMGTLIPLGPGIQALGNADTAALSSSLLVAFDTTVAGLVAAAVCLVVGKIRDNWYGNYMSALDSAMATMLQKIEDMREAGLIQIEEPTDFAFLFEKQMGKKGGKKPSKRKAKDAAKQAAPAVAGEGALDAALAADDVAMGAEAANDQAFAGDPYDAAFPQYDTAGLAYQDASQEMAPVPDAGFGFEPFAPNAPAEQGLQFDQALQPDPYGQYDQLGQLDQGLQFDQFGQFDQFSQVDQAATTGPIAPQADIPAFDQQPTGGIPRVDASYAAPAPVIPEVLMPSFLDGLAPVQPEPLDSFQGYGASAPADQNFGVAAPEFASDAPVYGAQPATDAADQPADGWYQAQAFASTLPEIPVPTWDFGQVTGPIDPVQEPEE